MGSREGMGKPFVRPTVPHSSRRDDAFSTLLAPSPPVFQMPSGIVLGARDNASKRPRVQFSGGDATTHNYRDWKPQPTRHRWRRRGVRVHGLCLYLPVVARGGAVDHRAVKRWVPLGVVPVLAKPVAPIEGTEHHRLRARQLEETVPWVRGARCAGHVRRGPACSTRAARVRQPRTTACMLCQSPGTPAARVVLTHSGHE